MRMLDTQVGTVCVRMLDTQVGTVCENVGHTGWNCV